jgi:hypothetical protein
MAHKIRVITLKRIKDESFVSLGDLGVREPPLVCEVHLRRHRAGVQTGGFGVHLEVDSLGGLDSDNELVAGDVLKDALRDIFELNTDFDFGFVQC